VYQSIGNYSVATMISEKIKQQLLDRYDPDDIIYLLEISTEDLIDELEHLILRNLDKFNLDDD